LLFPGWRNALEEAYFGGTPMLLPSPLQQPLILQDVDALILAGGVFGCATPP